MSRRFHKEMAMTARVVEDFSGAEFGDGRFNRKLIQLPARFADKPTINIPQACGEWAET